LHWNGIWLLLARKRRAWDRRLSARKGTVSGAVASRGWPPSGDYLRQPANTPRAFGLAHVLLGQAQKPPVPLRRRPPGAVESFDGQHLQVFEAPRLAGRHGQAVGRQDPGAQPLVFDRVAHVELHAPDQAERKLQDVGGGRGAVRQVPPAIHLEQRRLHLCASDRDAQVGVFAPEPQHLRRGGGTRQSGHLGLGQGIRLQRRHAGEGRAHWQDLQRACAVTASF
jgi:hypothetical protein